MLPLLVLVASLAMLAVGAELLIRGATGIARLLKVSTFVIGLTVVGFGTSAPELAASITAVVKGHADLSVGNVVGSNIFNVLVVLGIASLLQPIVVTRRSLLTEVPWTLGASAAIYLCLLSANTVERWMGVLLVLGLVVYLVRSYFAGRRDHAATLNIDDIPGGAKKPRPWLDLVLIVAGLAILSYGSTLLVESSVTIARSLGISELVIALTIIAGGTSAPEVFTTVVAAIRKKSDLALGNVLGSSVFNVLGILGITAIIRPTGVNDQVLVLDGPIMLLATLAIIPMGLSRSNLGRTEGASLLAVYCVYLFVLIFLAPGWFGPPAP